MKSETREVFRRRLALSLKTSGITELKFKLFSHCAFAVASAVEWQTASKAALDIEKVVIKF
jgi:hypothetical protein